MSDCAITVLHARGRRLAKLIHPDGSVIGYDEAKLFDAIEIGVRALDHLAERLLELLPLADRCVVRGSLIHGSPAHGIRRLLHRREGRDEPTLYEVPRRWIAIDVEGIARPAGIAANDVAACAQAAMQHMPSEFHGKACIAVATGQHGLRPDSRLRLFYWLDGAANQRVLQAWFYGVEGVDLCTFRPVQPIYTARPVLAEGVTDPVPNRLVMLPGEPLVPIRPLPTPVPREARAQPQARAGQPRQAQQPEDNGRRPTGNGSPPPPIGSRRADAYRDSALIGIKADLLTATEGQRHHRLVAAARRLFELPSITDNYVDEFIHAAARTLNAQGTRQIDADEVDAALDWARCTTASTGANGRAAA